MKIAKEDLFGTGTHVWSVQIREYIGGNEFEEEITRDLWVANDYGHLMEQLAEQNVYHLSGEFGSYDWDPRRKEKIEYGKEGRTGKDFETSIDEHWGEVEIDCLGPYNPKAKSYEIRLVEVEEDDEDDEDEDED